MGKIRMPELPEVETVVRDLNKKVKGLKIVGLWTDWPKYFSARGGSALGGKLPKGESAFKKDVVGRKILSAERRGKNILIHLSDDHLLLIHQKMSGHMLYGKWVRDKNIGWLPDPAEGPMTDPKNRFIRLIFFLNNGKMLALSDLRRFAKALCGPKGVIFNTEDLKSIGPEPLAQDFNFAKFKELFKNKKGKIKQVLMDQGFIAGIGNIYSDEILYTAKIHPLSRVEKLKEPQLKSIYSSMKKILNKAIDVRGTSIDDFRDTSGKKGKYAEMRMVYQKEGEKCPRGHIIERIKLGGRSAHFCPRCQRAY